MEALISDLRYAVRTLLKSPGFSLIAILTLGLGIGANTAIFSVVNSVVLRPLPFPDQDQLLQLGEGGRGQQLAERGAFSFPDYRDLQAQTQTLSHVAAFLNSGAMLSTEGLDAERIFGAVVTPEFFAVLGVQPALGRSFTVAEDQSGAAVVVISHGLWQRRFAGRKDIIGQTVRMGAATVSIIGVMPAGFSYPIGTEQRDFWEPLNDRPGKDQRDNRSYEVIGRLKQGTSLQSARADLDTISRRLEQQYPQSNTTVVIAAARLQDDLTRDARPALFILLGAVGFVLLIACANVANLQLARAAGRQKEIAVRNALGASRVRIVRQLLVESVLLAITGGALALLVTTWSLKFFLGSASKIPRIDQVTIDLNVLIFTLAVSLLTGIGFGLLPALQLSTPELTSWLKDGSRGSTGRRSSRVRNWLVISEVALSLMLLVGAGLLLKSFVRLLRNDPGFDASQVIALDIPLSRQRYDTDDKQARFFTTLVDQARNLPGVQAAAVVNDLPLGSLIDTLSFNVAGRPPYPPGATPQAFYTVVSPDYFETMRIPLKSGRLFSAHDTRDTAPVMLVSESLVRKYFSSENPLGLRLILDPKLPPLEIIGVVGDARRLALDTPADAEFYVPFAQAPIRRMNLLVRTTAANPATIVPAIRQTLVGLDREQMIWQTQTLDQLVSASVADRQFSLLMLGSFAALALILAALGIYGVMTYSVRQRTHEIGIRMALGAGAREVLRLVIAQGMTLTLIGATIGLAGALALTRLMSGLLFDVKPNDVWTYAAVAIGLQLVALIACFVPARRATKVDPLVALRDE